MDRHLCACAFVLTWGTLFASTLAYAEGGNAGIDNAVAVCQNAPPFMMIDSLLGSPQPGGIWNDPGGSPHSLVFVPGVDPAGTYCYVVGNDTACLTITSVAPANAGTNGYAVLCSTGPATSYFPYLGGNPQTGGSWYQCGPNTMCYVVPGIAPCPNDTASVTVVVNQAPDAGIDAIIEICANAGPVVLFDSIAGTPQPGGTWTFGGGPQNGIFVPGVNTPGIYCYIVAGLAPCPNAVSCQTVIVVPSTDPACLNTGIGTTVASSPSLSPEPNSGVLHLVGMSDGEAPADVYDQLGRIQWQGTLVPIGGRSELQLPGHIRNGRYTLILRNAHGADVRLPFTVAR